MLPKLKLIVSCQLSIVVLLTLSLFTFHLSLLTPSAYAAACQDARFTDKLTKNALDPVERTFIETGRAGEERNLEIGVTLDFSKIQAIFAKPNSDYLESHFQDQDHREQNILNLSSSNFNSYHGPGQKAAPKVMVDQLKQKYVQHVDQKPTLAEYTNQYSDIEGKNPKTIADLVQEFGQPNPPSLGGDTTTWQSGWARYWEKIPTAVSEFYYGRLEIQRGLGEEGIQGIDSGNSCPLIVRVAYFVLPEYFRTSSIVNQINQLVVPFEAQSTYERLYKKNFIDSTLGAAKEGATTAFSKIIESCLKPFANTPISKLFQKVIKISHDFLTIKDAYAATISCLGFLSLEKEGNAPFCTFPSLLPKEPNYLLPTNILYLKTPQPQPGQPQLLPGESCSGSTCQFKIITTLKIDGGGWDKCKAITKVAPIIYQCEVKIKIYPVLWVPWLAPIWNNTTYSHQNENAYIQNTEQKTGRPGIYSLFKPKSVDFAVFPEDPKNTANNKNLPSNPDERTGTLVDSLRQRFFGAVDCNKEFSRDVALKPKALQEFLGISPNCQSSTPSPTPTPENSSENGGGE